MTFLTPIPAIIAAAITLPVLVSLYLLKLRRRPVRVGSTMLWSDAAEDLQANVPFRWLRPSLLLLLQVLILACLVLALGRPTIRSAGAMPEQVFMLIDRSASMRATDAVDGPSRLDAAVRLARESIDRLITGSFGGEVTLIAFASDTDILAGPTRSKRELRDALSSLRATDEPGDLGAALRLIAGLTSDADDESEGRPLVLVFSDGAAAGDLPAIASEVVLERPRLDPDRSANTGFVALAARRDDRTPSLVRVFARLRSSETETITTTVAVAIDGETRRREVVELIPTEDGSSSPLSLDLEMPGAGLVTLSLEREDALSVDDSVSFEIGAPRRPAVLLVRETESEDAGAGWLLTDVLREMSLSSLTLVSSDRLRSLGAGAFVGVDLVVYDGVAAPALPPVASLHFGRSPPIDGLTGREVGAGVVPVIAWHRDHDVMRDVSLDTVRIGRTLVLDARDDLAMTELARTRHGAVAGAIEVDHRTHLVIGFDLSQSTWPLHYSFPLFLANAIDALPAIEQSSRGRQFEVGEPVTLDDVDQAATLRDPAGGVRRRVENIGTGVRLGALELAGVWSLGGRLIPVNLLDERETLLTAPVSLALPDSIDAGSSAASSAGVPREIWPMLLLVAFVLLAAEWLLFGARLRV